MLFIKKEIAGTPTLVPLTGDALDTIPIGFVMGSQYYTYDNPPTGYLPCDGSTFDLNAYPELFELLGTNVLPDYREVGFVGTGCNCTLSIATHDVYTNGQFKDDQFQDHRHCPNGGWGGGGAGSDYWRADGNNPSNWWQEQCVYPATAYRCGSTTHGKQVGMSWFIKAYHTATYPVSGGGGGGGGDIGCHWCSTATYACITNSSNVSLANLTATKAQVGPFTFCGDNGYIYNGADVVTGKVLACAAELPANNCENILYLVP